MACSVVCAQPITVSARSAGLSIRFDQFGVPDAVVNADGDNLVDRHEQSGFWIVEADGTQKRLDQITQLAPRRFRFSIAGADETIVAQFDGDGSYLTVRLTEITGFRLSGERLQFKLVGGRGRVRALPLDYMTKVRDINEFVELERLSLWETSEDNPLGGFALYEYVDDDQEDEVLLDLWTQEGLPHPQVEGNWDQDTARAWLKQWIAMAADTSYLNYVPHDLSQHDQVIPYATAMDAKSIYLWNSVWRGEYWLQKRRNDEINPDMYPRGLKDMEAFRDRLATHDLSLMFHYLSGSIGEENLAPAALDRLNELQNWGTMRLVTAVGPDARKIRVQPDSGVSLPTISQQHQPKLPPPVLPRYFDFKTFRINDEWLTAETVVEMGDGTWDLRGVRRGLWNTEATSHSVESGLRGFLRTYNQDFVPDPNSNLFDKVAIRWANLANNLKLARASFDGLENHSATGRWGSEKFAAIVYENLDHPTSANTSHGSPPKAWLEYRFNFVRRALGGNFQTREHVGLFLGDRSRITPGVEELEMTMFQFLSRNNRGFSLGSYDVKGVTLATLRSHGLTSEILDLLARWKRASFALSPGERKAMDTFVLHDSARLAINGSHRWAESLWRLDGPDFRQWHALGTDTYTHRWHSGQEHGTITPRIYLKSGQAQKLQVPRQFEMGADQVRLIGRVLPASNVDSPQNIDLMKEIDHPGVIELTRSNKEAVPVWSYDRTKEYRLKQPMDLSRHRGLRIAVLGDGSGATLVISLCSRGKARDYVVPIDFNGPRWIEIPTGEQGWRVRTWGLNRQGDTYKNLDYENVDAIRIQLGHVPAKTDSRVSVGRLVAMAEVKQSLVEPTCRLGEQQVKIDRVVLPEHHFILDPDGKFCTYDEHWNIVDTQQLDAGLKPIELGTLRITTESSQDVWLEVGVQVSNKTNRNLIESKVK